MSIVSYICACCVGACLCMCMLCICVCVCVCVCISRFTFSYFHALLPILTPGHTQEAPLVQDKVLASAILDSTLGVGCIEDFFLTIVLCNTVVVVTHREEGDGSSGHVPPEGVVYEAESPDEAALVEVL